MECWAKEKRSPVIRVHDTRLEYNLVCTFIFDVLRVNSNINCNYISRMASDFLLVLEGLSLQGLKV